MGVPNATFASRLNGNVFLVPSSAATTLQVDAAAAQLFGKLDRDWYLPDAFDAILDNTLDEFIDSVF